MKKMILLLILLSACTSVSYEEHTDAGSKYILNNGMTVLLKENHDTGMVAIDYMIKKTLAADGEKHGLGFFTTRMLLAGTQKRSRDDITREIEAAGGVIRARTYAEYGEIVIEIPSDRLSLALDILQDITHNSMFSPEEIERERTIILGELESKKDQPGVVAEELFMKTMYANHPYQHPIDGYVENVQAITREDIVRHYDTWYPPNNIIVSIVGNIKEKNTIRKINALFGKKVARQIPSENVHELTPRQLPEVHKEAMPVESMYIQYGFQLVPATHPDFIKLRLANAILGSGSGSRLFYELRDKRALAYSVYSLTPSTRSTGFIKIVMISRPPVLNESLSGIAEQVQSIQKEEVPADELSVVKQKLKGFFFLDHQRTADQANYLGFYEMQGYGYHYDVEYPSRLDTVTAEDIKQVANTYFYNPAIAIVGPFEKQIE